MKKQLSAALFTLVLATSLTNAQDEKIRISGVTQDVTQECDGKGVVVSGSSNTVKLTGDCPDVTVSGTGNKVSIDTASSIRVSGAGNAITYRSTSKGKSPKISNSGVDNSVKKE